MTAKGEKKKKITFKNKKEIDVTRRLGHTIGHNEFVVNILTRNNILERKKMSLGKTFTTVLKASRQKHSS
jgi:hypothetical protein